MKFPGRLFIPLLIIVTCVLYISMVSYSSPRIIISVQSDPPLAELARLVQEQRQQIEYLSSHPKVVFRCLDDEPKIKYPRRASDDLTEIVMDTNDECGNASVDAVMLVHTSASHFDHRHRFRKYYADFNMTSPYRLKVVFLIGSVMNATLQLELERENMHYGDTVVGAFLDTYQNLTLKAVMGFRWLTKTCPDVKLLFKMDDDVFLDIRKFYTRYWMKVGESRRQHSIHCMVWKNAHVGRTGKWKVERGLWANASYPFPYCAGFIVVLTPDLIKPIYEFGKSIDFFWIDDVFLYGMVPERISNVQFVQAGRSASQITDRYHDFVNCKRKRGPDKCPLWATLTDGASQLEEEFVRLYPPPTPKPEPATPQPQTNQTVIQSKVAANKTGDFKAH